MALPSSGPIAMGDISVELAYPATQIISLNDADVRGLAQVPAGVISLSSFYGKSNVTPAGYAMGGWTNVPGSTGTSSISEFNFQNETASTIGATTPSGTAMSSIGNIPSRNIGVQINSPADLNLRWQRFSFSSKTFTASTVQALPLGPAPGLSLGSRMQDSLQNKAFAIGGTSVAPSFTWCTKFNLDNDTWSSAPFAVYTPGNSNANSNSNSWTAAKNYSKGLVGGGNSPPNGTSYSSRLHRVAYPTETAVLATTSSDLTLFGGQPGTSFNNAEFGYTYTGNGPSPTGVPTRMGRIVFATETYSRAFQNIGTPRIGSGAWQTPTFAYAFGGRNGAALIGEIARYTFSNGALNVMSASIPARTYSLANAATSSHAQSSPVFG